MYKSQPHVKEAPDAPQPRPLAGALVAFTVNGESQGVAYRYAPAPAHALTHS